MKVAQGAAQQNTSPQHPPPCYPRRSAMGRIRRGESRTPWQAAAQYCSDHSTITVKDNLLHYEREYVVRQVEIPAEKAASFRKLEGAILADEKGTAVLKKQ